MTRHYRLVPLLSCVLVSVAMNTARAQARSGEIRGRVVESVAGSAIGSGSVNLRRAADTTVVASALLREDGSFTLTRLSPASYTLSIRALGYAPYQRPGIVVSPDKPIDLGVIRLVAMAASLSGQQVVAEREDVQLAPDRTGYATKNMVAATGGTAIDVLRNVPAVEVDGDNKISLRGNENITVQINGRTSALKGEQLGAYLAQLPASTVARVEVATNPSAKNDPDGAGGIINIILTQQTEEGLSGGLSLATGTTGAVNVSGNIGRQSGPVTLFTSVSVLHDTRDLDGSSARTSAVAGAPAFVNSRIGGSQDYNSRSVTVRSEYKLTDADALSFDAIASTAHYARLNTADYSDLDASRFVTGRFDQSSDQTAPIVTQDYAAAYRRNGGAASSTFSVELRYTQYRYALANILSTDVLLPDPSTAGVMAAERDASSLRIPTYTLQSDFAHPFANHFKLESGVKAARRTLGNSFTVADVDSVTGALTSVPSRASAFEFTEDVAAAYVVGTRQFGRFTSQAGLRAERAATTLDVGSPSPTDNNYASLFPSALVSYDLTDTRQVKASYSRRITRPDPFQLNPIAYSDDARNVFTGNPALRPEYTNAFELGAQETRSWGSLQLNPYYRSTANAVRYIRNVNAAGITYSTYANVASASTAGVDVNANIHGGAFAFTGGGGAYHYVSDAGNLAGDPSTRTFVWSTRANVTWTFTPVLDAQFAGSYRAPIAVEGGTVTAYVQTNFTLRDKVWGDQGSITLRVSDPFRMMDFGRTTADAFATEFSERRFGLRGVFITVTRNFGQELKLVPRTPADAPATAPASPP